MRGSLHPLLNAELKLLHPRQREAALCEGSLVVRAGPGSGKTRTLVARAGFLLAMQISPFRGVACITYTNAAADEMRRRLTHLGVAKPQRLVCSTLHSFCLNEILRAFAAITDEPPPAPGAVLGEQDSVALLQHCFDQIGVMDTAAQWRQAQITKIRRAIACNEGLGGFDSREVEAASLYERRLRERGETDFEDMVIRALSIVRTSGHVQDLLRARFPHLIVDEYQDLGGVLHRLVLALHEAGITVCAVGDADQTVFGFTGADPKYLEELAARSDFRQIELDVNYRSGHDIIRASEAGLGAARGRLASDGAPTGDVELISLSGSLDAHAREVVRLLVESDERGVPQERMAVLYPARGPLLDELVRAFDERGLLYLHERDEQFPRAAVSQFVQRCASRAVLAGQVRNPATTALQTDALLLRTEAPSLVSLESELLSLRRDASLPAPATRLHLLRQLQRALDPREPTRPDDPVQPWLVDLVQRLDLAAVAAGHPNRDNEAALTTLLGLGKELTLQDLAADVQVLGKIILTTYHSAKGREFHTVILPGLVNGLVPRDVPHDGRWQRATGRELQEQRRAFYVALSRAERQVYLITGPGYHTVSGYWINQGPSDFLVDMMRTLGA